MTDHHFEPYLCLVDLTHQAALIAWGGFWFRLPSTDRPDQAVIVDDEDLGEVSPGRSETIGARSRPYGEAVVEALDADGKVVAGAATRTANHVWLTGLEPDTSTASGSWWTGNRGRPTSTTTGHQAPTVGWAFGAAIDATECGSGPTRTLTHPRR